MTKYPWFKHWQKMLEPAPLECDGMTRCISTLLHHHHIQHSVHIGALTVDGVGRIPLHWWIVLESREHIDLRARMWLGNHENVPHGLFMPSSEVRYETLALQRKIDLDAFIFALLCGHEISDFLIDQPVPEPCVDSCSLALH